jgi:hypothetical protein
MFIIYESGRGMRSKWALETRRREALIDQRAGRDERFEWSYVDSRIPSA